MALPTISENISPPGIQKNTEKRPLFRAYLDFWSLDREQIESSSPQRLDSVAIPQSLSDRNEYVTLPPS
jgi:hypothetical protein